MHVQAYILVYVRACLCCVVLAVGRSDATISLLNIEDGHAMHTHTLTYPITSLHWMTQDQARYVNENPCNEITYSFGLFINFSIRLNGVEYKDRSLSFLPPLPSLDTRQVNRLSEPENLPLCVCSCVTILYCLH